MKLREQDLVGMHLSAGREGGRRIVEVTKTQDGQRGVPLYEGRLFDATSAAMLHRTPYRSMRKGAMRRWWKKKTRGDPVPEELQEVVREPRRNERGR
ncbi:hypothetical protein BH24ACT19_BH24ACT19_08100 [soil metagenome]